MYQRLLVFVATLFFLCPLYAFADSFESHASYTVCFTPGEDCTYKIVSAIDQAVHNIWVQAYSFTSRPISKALVLAKKRGVDVKVIFDKTALDHKQGAATYLVHHGIPIWIDNQPTIAHNKVIIVDQTRVITGSFNFTRAAQQKNAENVLLISDAGLAKQYLKNWQSRQRISMEYANDNTRKQKNGSVKLSEVCSNWFKSWF